MALRILPFRQYSDHDVVNMYSVVDADVLDSTTGAGAGDAGVFVKVQDGNFDNDPVTYQTNSYLGDTSYPFLGTTEMYPQVNLKITGAANLDQPLGLTLYQTAKNDENGEKLLYHPRKAAENDWVISGQAAPVLTRGVVLYSGATLASDTPTLGEAVYTSPDGELTSASTLGTTVGKTLGLLDARNHILLKLEL